MIRTRRKAAGFMIIEVLVAAAIIAVSVLGLAGGFKILSNSREKTVGVATALAFESSLQWALQNPASYNNPANPTNALDHLQNPPYSVDNFVFDIPLTKVDGTEFTTPFTIDGNDHFYKEDGSPGSASDWFFKAVGQGIKLPGGGSTKAFAVAYHIEFNSARANIGGLGSPTSTFSPNDYKWMIPVEVYYNKLSLKKCDPSAGDVVVTGVDPETGDVSCLGLGGSACSSDEIATGWVYDNSPVPHLKLNCRKMFQSATCPVLEPGYEYVIQDIKPSSATDGAIQGHCVFKAYETKAGGVAVSTAAPTHSANFEVCPKHYKFIPSGPDAGCSYTIVQTFQGWQDVGCPSGTGVNWVQNVNPTPMSITGAITAAGSKKDREVTCTLVNDKQDLGLPTDNNWAGFSAQISVSGNCVLNDLPVKPL